MPQGRAALAHLDERLAETSRQEGALRLRLGQLLEVLGRPDSSGSPAHSELGFLRLSAYVRERCELGVRWAQSARAVARRLEGLPALRAAVARGEVGWSQVELLSESASPQDEIEWLGLARRWTVRQLREEARRRRAGVATEDATGSVADVPRELRLRVDQEDFWLWQATRSLFSLRLGTPMATEQGFALLAEAHTTLTAEHPELDLHPDSGEWREAASAAWRAQREAWRREAEMRCEARLPAATPARADGALAVAVIAGLAALDGQSPAELDASVRAVSRDLAEHDFALGQGLLELHRADGWRRLGYASERQYAQERLGMSRSTVYARRGLALRLERLPAIAASLRRGELGVEAAVAVVRVATPATEGAWVERARRRTLKMLREEVDAASVAQRVSGEADCPPPSAAELDGYFALERAVVNAAVLSAAVLDRASAEHTAPADSVGGGAPVQMSAHPTVTRPYRTMLASLGAWLESGLEGAVAPIRRGAALRWAGRVGVRLRLSSADYEYWHLLERAWRRATHGPMSFIRYACLAVWDAWRHVLGGEADASAVLTRDRGRCTCPVCDGLAESRHHVVFRSRGGSDEDGNLTALCPRCHLDGIHAGRLTAEGSAPDLRWAIGRTPLFRVEGRERLPA